MTSIVIDTNILVSACLSPEGNPAKIMEIYTTKTTIRLFYASKIFEEYNRVLSYERLNIKFEKKEYFLNQIKRVGILAEPTASIIPMPDETDRIFYDTAKSSGAFLITGNMKHYPQEPFIITATEFLEKLYYQ
jgi:putative PIN family toxin of toxin-antitoxin system